MSPYDDQTTSMTTGGMADTPTANDASSPTPTSTRERRANTSITGPNVTITFTSGETVELDVRKVPGAGQINGMAEQLLAYGAAAMIQTAYNASKTPVEAAKVAVNRLLNGTWSPGLPRKDKGPDLLIQALSEHLGRPAEDVESKFLPGYAKKHGYLNAKGEPAMGVARRQLRAHPEVAAILAKLTAEHAKRAAQTAKQGLRTAPDLRDIA